MFNEEEAQRFPPSRPWDHAVELKPTAPDSLNCKIYPLSQKEKGDLWEFLDEQLAKGYIRPSKSQYTSPFFIKKKDGKLHPVVTSDPVTSVTNARVLSPRPATAEELVGVTAMFGRLHIRPASLEPKKGSWAYRKTSPGPDDIPASSESHLWDGFHNLQEPADEDGDDTPLEDEERAQIRHLVCGAPFPGDSLPTVSLGSLGHHVT